SEKHANVDLSLTREDPLIHLDTEECVTHTDLGFAERASHHAACKSRPNPPHERGESSLFRPEWVERDARQLSVREDDLARNCIRKFEFAYLGRTHVEVGLLCSLAHGADHVIRHHSQMQLANGCCDEVDA